MAITHNDLSLDLRSIDDVNVRSALLSIMTYVQDLSSRGLMTDGPVKCSDLALQSGAASIDKKGVIRGDAFDFGNQGSLRYFLRSGTLTQLSTGTGTDLVTYTVPGVVIGAIGWTSINGSSTDWRPLQYESTGNNGCYFVGTTSSQYNEVLISNTDTGHSNSYRAIIFYQGS